MVTMLKEVPGKKALEVALQHWSWADQQACRSLEAQPEPQSSAVVVPPRSLVDRQASPSLEDQRASWSSSSLLSSPLLRPGTPHQRSQP